MNRVPSCLHLSVPTWLFSALVKELIVGLTSQIGLKDSKRRHSFQELWVWQEFCFNRNCHFSLGLCSEASLLPSGYQNTIILISGKLSLYFHDVQA